MEADMKTAGTVGEEMAEEAGKAAVALAQAIRAEAEAFVASQPEPLVVSLAAGNKVEVVMEGVLLEEVMEAGVKEAAVAAVAS